MSVDNSAVAIVFCSDSNYAPILSVALQSILETANRDRSYIVYIITQDIGEQNQVNIERQIAQFSNFSMQFIDPTPYIADIAFKNLSYTIHAYFRLLIPYIFAQYKKVIYLDCDVIVLDDIAKLYDSANCADENNMLAAVADTGFIRSVAGRKLKGFLRKTKIGRFDIFNSGVLVFFVENFKKYITMRALLELAASEYWSYADQDVLNIACKDRIQ
ncbi:MAG: hypothetical protein LBN32_04215, partial [Helicobacteraceae bacterium]|nr:hypothetical protein [Helicobacteraceae bacterium]